jgi:HEAT repeat protein
LYYKLCGLVKADDDPFPLYWIALNVTVPPGDPTFYFTRVPAKLREKTLLKIVQLTSPPPVPAGPAGPPRPAGPGRFPRPAGPGPMPRPAGPAPGQLLLTALHQNEIAQLEQMEREVLQREALFEQGLARQQALTGLLKEVTKDEGPDALRDRLQDANPVLRWIAVQVVAGKRMHLETELIDRLDDPAPDVRASAHDALVYLGRGVDFGPPHNAGKAVRRRAVDHWRAWLALQNPAADTPGGAATDPLLGWAVLRTAPADAEEAEALRLSRELTGAAPDERAGVLARLRDAKGVANTDALALAIPDLPEDERPAARDALADRLTRMKAATLRDKFQHEDPEVRAAAAEACARKEAEEMIPDLLGLLDDPDTGVVQAARSALRSLTGKDFGPASDAEDADAVRSAGGLARVVGEAAGRQAWPAPR